MNPEIFCKENLRRGARPGPDDAANEKVFVTENRLGRKLGIVGIKEPEFFIGNGPEPFDDEGLQIGEVDGIEALGDNLLIGAVHAD